jgi:hypothetical protein
MDSINIICLVALLYAFQQGTKVKASDKQYAIVYFNRILGITDNSFSDDILF